MSGKRKSKFEGKFPAGHKFSNWTVVDGIIHDSPAKIDVRCICGTERRVDVYTLNKGKSTNCGCQKIGESSPVYTGHNGLSGTAIYRNMVRAEQLGDVQISSNDAVGVFTSQSGNCYLTGQTLTSMNARLERIDPTQPYVSTNVAWVHNSISPTVRAYGVSNTAHIANSIVSATPNPNIFEQLGMKPNKRKK
jgi:hypothetical protein